MAENANEPAEEHQASHGPRRYVKVWAVLVVLLIISVMGPFVGIKAVTLATAFGVAIVKAYLVASNFMHLDVERRYVVYLLLTAVVLMLLLFAGVAPDVMNHEGQNWVNVAAAEGGEEGVAAQGVAAEWSAETTFATVCAACHGSAGRGDGPAAAALNPHPANFTDPAFWETRDKQHIVTVIRDGGAAVGRSPLMVGFGGQYDAEQLDALADYVMSFSP